MQRGRGEMPSTFSLALPSNAASTDPWLLQEGKTGDGRRRGSRAVRGRVREVA